MSLYDPSLAPLFSQLLNQREAEQCEILQGNGELHRTPCPPCQQDRLKAVIATLAAKELVLLRAARKRLASQRYGQCMQCAGSIDLRRLTALPATLYCTACQAAHEHQHQPAVHRSTLHLTKGKFA